MGEEAVIVDLHQIQGLVASGYPRSPAARYLLLGVEQADAARAALRGLADRVTFRDRSRDGGSDEGSGGVARLNVAFSAAGLLALGVRPDELIGFAREFREGMVTPHRQRLLGDLDGSPSDPLQWLWGGPNNRQVHCALLLFEADES